MTFLQALYGSQYKEIKDRGGDASKGRTNANLFLSVFFLLILILLFLLASKILPVPTPDTSGISGRAIGKLLAIPLIAIVYFIIINTIGTKTSYKKMVDEFYMLPSRVQETANQKILVPFFVILALIMMLVIF